jgi:hypothetical protein
MRILSAVVQIPALSMFDLRKDLALRHTVASQLVGHDHSRRIVPFSSRLKKRLAALALAVPARGYRAKRRLDTTARPR